MYHFRYQLNYIYINMAKLYAKKKTINSTMLPKSETLKFILSYSAALNVVKVGKQKIEIIAN